MAYINACRFVAASGGAGDFVVSGPAGAYRTPAQASAVNGQTYGYRAESPTGSEWEFGIATYDSATTTAIRTTVLGNHLGTTAKVAFTLAPVVGLLPIAEQFFAKVSTLAELRALDTTVTTAAELTLAGRAGKFFFRAGNYSTHVATDTNEGVYIKANAIASSAGAWVRFFDFQTYWSKWFGTVADHATDNSSIINTIIATTDLTNTLSTPGKQSAALIEIEGGVRFASTSLSFLPAANWVFVYLSYFANSDTTKGVATGAGGTNERVQLSVNSGYPGDATGGMVGQWDLNAPLHPGLFINVMKHISGADAHFGTNQVRQPTTTNPARASLTLADEGLDRWRTVYEGFGGPDTAGLPTHVRFHSFLYSLSLANVGSTGWPTIPTNGTIITGVTSGAKMYKTGHSGAAITGVWITGNFLPGEKITDGVTTSTNSISGGGIGQTLSTNPFLAFGINAPTIGAGIWPNDMLTAFGVGGRLTVARTNASTASNHIENVSNAAILFTNTNTNGTLPTTGKQIVLDNNGRLVIVNGVAASTTPRGYPSAVTASGRFTHAGLAPMTGSLNFASVTNPSTGRYDITLTNALASANYGVNVTGQGAQIPTYDLRSTTGFSIFNYNLSGALANLSFEATFTIVGGDA